MSRTRSRSGCSGSGSCSAVQRQRIVQRGGRRFVIVLEEQALRTWFGSAEVQAGQPGRLLEVMALPQVSLGIIPLLWWTGFGVVVGGCSHHFRAGIRSSTDLAGGQRW
ncbi:Scr1 family TA system antitoxin-like transcriptional regulator [Nocardia salmonicida]|uniref:Scr1 family TA system antitoxin-like transcriptional regulator n=1 Tax=Nocardia salmonicida TaxID=53431 RepID=UPI0034100E40